MYYYRVTKYDPKLRDEAGRYMQDEWTDFSCVGIKINDQVCTLEAYEVIESLYVSAVMQFVSCADIDYMECRDVEMDSNVLEGNDTSSSWKSIYERVSSGSKISKTDLPVLLKLLLRNYLWCRLAYDDKMFVHFGYDYYMYVGIEKECRDVVEHIAKAGLFIEAWKSPYLDNKDERIA